MDFTPNRRRSDRPSRGRVPAKSGDMWSAFDDFFNSRFADLPMTSELNNFSPEVNIKETKDSYIVEAEMPGLKRDDIDIELRGDELILKGEKRSFNEEDKDNYHHMERRYGTFYRTIPMDAEIDEDQCDANFSDGILTVKIKKKEGGKSKSKKINIQ
ncbi:MAG: Hsp20/alpha crystallin family protein [Bacteriovoracaceae bacterium]|nr:Hsp20/alpha crystallin family protein [Bacteriovoracaceae bacterium]